MLDHPAHLPAARELRRLPDRVPPGGRATGFTTIVAVLIAGSLLGVVGAILAVPFAAVIKTVVQEAGAPRRARMEAMRAAEAQPLAPQAP